MRRVWLGVSTALALVVVSLFTGGEAHAASGVFTCVTEDTRVFHGQYGDYKVYAVGCVNAYPDSTGFPPLLELDALFCLTYTGTSRGTFTLSCSPFSGEAVMQYFPGYYCFVPRGGMRWGTPPAFVGSNLVSCTNAQDLFYAMYGYL